MNDFDDALAQLRADVVVPDAAATQRISARLSRTIAAPSLGDASAVRARLHWARPLPVIASFVIGGIVGAGLYGTVRPPTVERVYVDRPTASERPPVAPTEPEPTASEPLPSSKPAALAPAPSATVARQASLTEQQALLDEARVAYARGNYAQTLHRLAAHFARFPKSMLAEEREALQIKALAASDRLSEARTRALRFQARYPQSVLLPSIKDSVGAIP